MKQELARSAHAKRTSRPVPSSLLVAILAAFSAPVLAQSAAGESAAPANPGLESSANLSYVGARSRVGVGYDSGTHLRGEFSHVLTEDALSAIIAQGWLSRRSGGLRADYNWIGGSDGKPAADSLVKKVFGAVDRNRDNDRKATLGFGLETENWFGQLSYSHGLSDKRRRGTLDTLTETSQESGLDNGRPYVDTITTTTTTQLFERAYEHGIGVRAGHYYTPALLRLTLGFDREWAEFSSHQNTVSLNAEKFFAGSPHSLALHVEHYNKSGDYETRGSNTRVQVMYRYSFGGSDWANAAGWRQTRVARQLPVESSGTPARTEPAPPAPPPAMLTRSETRIVKTTATMTSDAFFELDKATLTDAARRELDRIADVLKASGHAGNIRITGHTCDLGSDAYNLKLSTRRAAAVRDYLVSKGAGNADVFVTEGQGEREPKYPNTRETRPKNRRVDLEFIQYQDKSESVEVPVPAPAPVVTPATPASTRDVPLVEWKTEVVDTEPAWVRRALHNTVRHKQTVDTYRGADTRRTSTTTRAYGNRVPVAADDAITLAANDATISVLSNDSDPDGNALSIVSVGTAQIGSVVIAGNALRYVLPADNLSSQVRSDTFTYTIDDGQGGRASARVTVTIPAAELVGRPPNAVDDRYVVPYTGESVLNVLANDSDPDGGPLTIVSFTQPSVGTIASSGTALIFSPSTRFTYSTFTYTIRDAQGNTDTATVELVDP